MADITFEVSGPKHYVIFVVPKGALDKPVLVPIDHATNKGVMSLAAGDYQIYYTFWGKAGDKIKIDISKAGAPLQGSPVEDKIDSGTAESDENEFRVA